jgi:hypothetical protein
MYGFSDPMAGQWHDREMRFGIVEGEPGIFPDPVARLLRQLARPFRDRARKDSETAPLRDDNREDAPPDDERA